MLTDAELQALWLTFKVSARAVLFVLPFAIACGWLLARRNFPGKTLFDGVVHLPLVVPPVVVGYLLLVLFGVKGLLGQPLNDWFGIRLVFTAAGASLAIAVTTFPLMVRAIRLALEFVREHPVEELRLVDRGELQVVGHVGRPEQVRGHEPEGDGRERENEALQAGSSGGVGASSGPGSGSGPSSASGSGWPSDGPL